MHQHHQPLEDEAACCLAAEILSERTDLSDAARAWLASIADGDRSHPSDDIRGELTQGGDYWPASPLYGAPYGFGAGTHTSGGLFERGSAKFDLTEMALIDDGFSITSRPDRDVPDRLGRINESGVWEGVNPELEAWGKAIDDANIKCENCRTRFARRSTKGPKPKTCSPKCRKALNRKSQVAYVGKAINTRTRIRGRGGSRVGSGAPAPSRFLPSPFGEVLSVGNPLLPVTRCLPWAA